jgi:hypothetical protein
VARRVVRSAAGTTGARGWRRRQAAWRQAAEQKRRRPTGANGCPHTALIEGEHVVARPPRQGPPELALLLGFDQFVDQRGSRGEPHPPFLATGRHAQAREQMRLPRPAVPQEDHRLGPVEVAALGEAL